MATKPRNRVHGTVTAVSDRGEEAAEGAGGADAAGGTEFRVPEMLDADPGAEAKKDDDGTCKLLAGNAGEEGEAGGDAADP